MGCFIENKCTLFFIKNAILHRIMPLFRRAEEGCIANYRGD